MKCYLIARGMPVAVGLAALLAACNGSDGSTGGRAAVATVTISPATANVEVGKTQQFTATMKDAKGVALTGRTVAWSSDVTSIASVHPTGGLMTGVTVGSARIIATSEGKSDTALVTVVAVPVATVTVSPTSASISVGQTTQLSATLKDAGGNTLTGRTVAWSSDKTSIATVNASTGLVSGVAAGTATITATSEGKQGTAAVTVTSSSTPGFGMTLSPTSLSVQQGKSGTAAVGLTRMGGFTGGVTLAVTGAPTGVTATASPSPATGNTSTLTVAVGSSAAVGSYTLTVRGTGSGVTAQTATLALTVTQVPVATVTVTPATPSVVAGQTVALTATLKDAGGNTLTGRTVSWSSDKTSIATVSSSGVVTGVAAGSATITATSEGKKGTAAVTVTAAATAGFTLTLSPTSLSVPQGSSGTSTATIARTGGFTGSVALAVSGAPTGLTATLAPTSTTGNSSTLTVAAASTLAAGSYTLTITGTGSGVASKTATLTVNVTASGGSSTSVTFSYCAEHAPIFVAYRDAGGTWRKATASGTNTYTFSLANSGGAVADITRDGTDSYSWSILYAKPSELSAAGGGSGITMCDPAPTGKTVRGTVAGLALGQTGLVALGSAFASVVGDGGSGEFILDKVPDGVQDLVATRSTPNETFSAYAVDKVIIRRGLNPADGSTLPVLDFGSSEAFAPASASVTLANLGSDDGTLLVSYVTGNTSSFGTFAPFYNASGFTSMAPTRTYYGVPDAKQASGELHALVASAIRSDFSTFRFAEQFFRTVSNRTLTLGPDLSAPTVTTAASTPYLRPRAQLPVQSEYNQMGIVSYTQSTPDRSVSVAMTAGYLAGGATYDLQIPDLSGLAGFDASWGLRSGAATDWSAIGFGGTFNFGLPGARPADGSTSQFASRSGTM